MDDIRSHSERIQHITLYILQHACRPPLSPYQTMSTILVVNICKRSLQTHFIEKGYYVFTRYILFVKYVLGMFKKKVIWIRKLITCMKQFWMFLRTGHKAECSSRCNALSLALIDVPNKNERSSFNLFYKKLWS